MKRRIVFCYVLCVIFLAGNLSAQELQISGGPEFGFGTFRVDNDSAFREGSLAYFFNEKTTTSFFAPGLSFAMRYFYNDNASSPGFFFRDRAIFITNAKITGSGSLNGSSFSISETYSAADDDTFIGIMDFDLGPSFKYTLSDKLQFYSDIGFNLTVMSSENEESGEELDYWGIGIYSDLALQLNLSKTMYLEFGLVSIINIVSSQKGIYFDDFYHKKRTYEDTGRWDLISIAPYIHIGWKLDVQKVRAGLYGTQAESP